MYGGGEQLATPDFFMDQLDNLLKDDGFRNELKSKNINDELIQKIFEQTKIEINELQQIEDPGYKSRKLYELLKVLNIIRSSDTVSSYIIEEYLQTIVDITIEAIVDEKASKAIKEEWSIDGDHDYDPFYVKDHEVSFYRNWRIDKTVLDNLKGKSPEEVVEMLNMAYIRKKMKLVVNEMIKDGIKPEDGHEYDPFYIEDDDIKIHSRLGEGVWYSNIDRSIFKNIPDENLAITMKEELNYMFTHQGKPLDENYSEIAEHVDDLALSTLQRYIDRKRIDIMKIDIEKCLKLDGKKLIYIDEKGKEDVIIRDIHDQEIHYFVGDDTKYLELFIKALNEVKRMKIYAESGGFDDPKKVKELADALINNPEKAKEMLTNMRYEKYSLCDIAKVQFFGDELQDFFTTQGCEYISYIKQLVSEPIEAGEELPYGGNDPNRESPIDKTYSEKYAYLIITESHGKPLAVSNTGARGLGQIMKKTAGLYGLRVGKLVDERLDPIATGRQIRLHLHEISTRKITKYINIDEETRLALYNNNYAEDIYLRPNKSRANFKPTFEGFLKEVGKILLEEVKRAGYKVKKGDTLGKLSKKFGISIAEIKKLNPKIKGNTIILGQILDLGNKSTVNVSHILEENLQYPFKLYAVWRIIGENRTQTNPRLRLKLENENKTENFQEVKLKINEDKVKAKEYLVKGGDNLFEIAKRYATTVARIKRRNGLKSDNIRPKQKLKIYTDKDISLSMEDIADSLGMNQLEKNEFYNLNLHIVYAQGPRTKKGSKSKDTISYYGNMGIQKNIFSKGIDGVSLYFPIGFAEKFNEILYKKKGYFQESNIVEYKDGKMREQVARYPD